MGRRAERGGGVTGLFSNKCLYQVANLIAVLDEIRMMGLRFRSKHDLTDRYGPREIKYFICNLSI